MENIQVTTVQFIILDNEMYVMVGLLQTKEIYSKYGILVTGDVEEGNRRNWREA